MDSDVMKAAREAIAACGGSANCEAWLVNQSRNKHFVALALAGIEAATQPTSAPKIHSYLRGTLIALLLVAAAVALLAGSGVLQ